MVWWEVISGGGGVVVVGGCILGMSRLGWERESESLVVCVPRFVSCSFRFDAERSVGEKGTERGGGLAVVFVLEGFLTRRRSRTTLEGGSGFHEANQPNRCSSVDSRNDMPGVGGLLSTLHVPGCMYT